MRLKTLQTVHQTLMPGSMDDHTTVFVDGNTEINRRAVQIDFDEEVGLVTVRNTKTQETRIIPLSNVASMEPMAEPGKKTKAA